MSSSNINDLLDGKHETINMFFKKEPAITKN